MSAKQIVVLAAVFITLGTAASASAHGGEPRRAKTSEPEHAAALGQPGDPRKATRTIEVQMDDSMRFSPVSIEVKRGETVRFHVKNTGRLKHELVLGTFPDLKAHAALMQKFPEMEHADPNQASVDPGKSGELIWQFTKPGTFDFACLQPGHFEAGMRGRLIVKR